MMMKRQDPPATATPTACGNCGVEERRFLHHVRHRGIFRRLCTSCVLRLHPQAFCPTCFAVYNPSPPSSSQNDTVTCIKCYSTSHIHCVGPNFSNPYTCPLCISPHSPVFTLKNPKDFNLGSKTVNNGNCKVIDKKASIILLAAAKIAASSMNKAAVSARAEAEKRAKEAAVARKKAKEALEHVAYLMAEEKSKRKEVLLASAEVSGSGGGNMGVVLEKRDNKSLILGGGSMAMEKNLLGTVNRVDGSSEVLAALNAVDLREKERLQGFKAQSGLSRVVPPSNGNSNGVAMDVEQNGGMKVGPGLNIGEGSVVANHGGKNGNQKTGDLGVLQNRNIQGDQANDVSFLVPSLENQTQRSGNNHDEDQSKTGFFQ